MHRNKNQADLALQFSYICCVLMNFHNCQNVTAPFSLPASDLVLEEFTVSLSAIQQQIKKSRHAERKAAGLVTTFSSLSVKRGNKKTIVQKKRDLLLNGVPRTSVPTTPALPRAVLRAIQRSAEKQNCMEILYRSFRPWQRSSHIVPRSGRTRKSALLLLASWQLLVYTPVTR